MMKKLENAKWSLLRKQARHKSLKTSRAMTSETRIKDVLEDLSQTVS